MGTNERRQHLRNALVDAAERVIAEHGLPGLKARDLAQEVGCALGAIYTVFPDLDGLVLEVNRRTLLLFEAHIAGMRAPGSQGAGAAVTEPSGLERPPAESAAGQAAADLERLGNGYLAFARAHTLRWRTLFEHRLGEDRPLPDWYLAEQGRLFRHIEGPLQDLRPDLSEPERSLLARSLFSATHGLVSLGLDEKLMALPPPVLEAQVRLVVGAAARGLAGAA